MYWNFIFIIVINYANMLIFLFVFNFLCISLFLNLLFFIVLLSRIVDDSQKGCYLRKNRKKHSSDNTSCKTHIHCTHKIIGNRHFFVTLVTNMYYISATVPPIFANRVLKCAQDVKEKSHEISVRDLFAVKKLSRKMSRGGG